MRVYQIPLFFCPLCDCSIIGLVIGDGDHRLKFEHPPRPAGWPCEQEGQSFILDPKDIEVEK